MAERSFSLEDWRSGLQLRREIGRLAILESLGTSAGIEPIISRLKRDICFDRLDARDKNVFNVMISDLRRVVKSWSRIEEVARRRFACGLMPYSALHKVVSAPDFLVLEKDQL